MLTLNDIINVSFRKSSFSGYRPEDVDEFIDEVKESYDLLIKKNIEQKESNDALTAENSRLQSKTDELQRQVSKMNDELQDYRQDEDGIKNALISAQKLGDASIREARHKAEIILKDANLKAERIVAAAQMEIMEQKEDLDRLKQLASDFRSNLLDMYKEHLTLVNALPSKKSSSVSANLPAKQPVQPAPIPPVSQEEEEEAAETPQPIPFFEQQAAREESAPDTVTPSAPVQEDTTEIAAPEGKRVMVPVNDIDEQETKSFIISREEAGEDDVSEPYAADEDDAPVHGSRDLRYDVLKFGDDYDITDDLDSPVGIFKRNKKSK